MHCGLSSVIMRRIKPKTVHPYIEKRRGYRGGRAIIAGTNFPVSSVVVYILKQGMLAEELVRTFPHLRLAEVHDALSYYYDHQAEIDKEIKINLSEDAAAASLPVKEVLRFKYDASKGEFLVTSLG
jgi:uncharacterized protein (DUF433 family)